jgi:hypothetical protein
MWIHCQINLPKSIHMHMLREGISLRSDTPTQLSSPTAISALWRSGLTQATTAHITLFPQKLSATNFPYNLQLRRERIVIHLLPLPPPPSSASVFILSFLFNSISCIFSEILSCFVLFCFYLLKRTQIRPTQRHTHAVFRLMPIQTPK